MIERNFTVNRENLEIISERVFYATPQKLYDAYTNPVQIPKWWGPETFSIIVDKMDTRQGGSWRFIYKGPNMEPFVWSGIYQELTPPTKLVSTFVFEPTPGHVHKGTVSFKEQEDGTTRLTETLKFISISDLDSMLSTGMEEGQTYRQERLAALTEVNV